MRKFLSQVKAQTAMELAIFGAILVFVLGFIVRQGLGSGYQQNQNLKAMRMAMKNSYVYSEGLVGTGEEVSSRNFGNVFLLEDRLTVDSTTFSPADRVPYMFSASASHSKNLFYTITEPTEEEQHLPIFDLYVNGQHFPIRTAGFKRICFEAVESSCGVKGAHFPEGNYDEWIPRVPGKNWVNNCLQVLGGCPLFYLSIANSFAETRWESPQITGPDPEHPNRFDLDHDGTVDVPASEQDKFSWQWYPIYGVNEKVRITSLGDGLIMTEDEQKNSSFDIDGDFQDEQILKIDKTNSFGAVMKVTVLDQQEGDIDFSGASQTEGQRIGLLFNMKILTKAKDGTYLKIDQGKLYNNNDQFVRSVQKKDTVDIIEREFQLTKNTGRFCRDGATSPQPRVDGEVNPVQACNNCHTAANIEKTCMNTTSLIVYIRTKPRDKRGRMWITDIKDDEYINLITPQNP